MRLFNKDKCRVMAKADVTGRRIVTEVEVWNKDSGLSCTVKGIWNTGAKMSSILRSLAEDLCMVPDPKTRMRVGTSNGIKISNLYHGTLILGEEEVDVTFTTCDTLVDDLSVIIGMDVIIKGDFSITNVGGKTEFVLRMPPKGHVIS